MTALESAGRRKASFIADAICEYLTRNGAHGAEVTIPLTPAPIHTTNATVSGGGSPKKIPEPREDVGAIISPDNISLDMREAILGGLSMFKK